MVACLRSALFFCIFKLTFLSPSRHWQRSLSLWEKKKSPPPFVPTQPSYQLSNYFCTVAMRLFLVALVTTSAALISFLLFLMKYSDFQRGFFHQRFPKLPELLHIALVHHNWPSRRRQIRSCQCAHHLIIINEKWSKKEPWVEIGQAWSAILSELWS